MSVNSRYTLLVPLGLVFVSVWGGADVWILLAFQAAAIQGCDERGALLGTGKSYFAIPRLARPLSVGNTAQLYRNHERKKSRGWCHWVFDVHFLTVSAKRSDSVLFSVFLWHQTCAIKCWVLLINNQYVFHKHLAKVSKTNPGTDPQYHLTKSIGL